MPPEITSLRKAIVTRRNESSSDAQCARGGAISLSSRSSPPISSGSQSLLAPASTSTAAIRTSPEQSSKRLFTHSQLDNLTSAAWTKDAIQPQSAGNNFKRAFTSPVLAAWGWIKGKLGRSVATAPTDKERLLDAKNGEPLQKAMRGIECAELFTEVGLQADPLTETAIDASPILQDIKTVGDAIEVLGMAGNAVGIAGNIMDLADRKRQTNALTQLEPTRQRLANFRANAETLISDLLNSEQELATAASTRTRMNTRGMTISPLAIAQEKCREAARAIDMFFSESDEADIQEKLQDLRAAAAQPGAPDLPSAKAALLATLDTKLLALEHSIHEAKSHLKGKDTLWMISRGNDATRQGLNLVHSGAEFAAHGGAAIAPAVTSVLGHTVGVLNVAAAGLATRSAILAGREAREANVREAEIGDHIAEKVRNDDSVDTHALLLEHQRRAEKNTGHAKLEEKKEVRYKAIDSAIRAGLWVAGACITGSIGLGVLAAAFTGAAVLLGVVGLGVAIFATYGKMKRQAEMANKAAGIQELVATFRNDLFKDRSVTTENTEESLRNRISDASLPAPERQRARLALRVLHQIQASDKYQPLVGQRASQRHMDAPDAAAPGYSADQILQIAAYKLAVRNAKPLAEKFLNDLMKDKPPHLPAASWDVAGFGGSTNAAFLRDTLKWEPRDIEFLVLQAEVDRNAAVEFFCDKNSLPIYKTSAAVL
jgi:hypothetical protein